MAHDSSARGKRQKVRFDTHIHHIPRTMRIHSITWLDVFLPTAESDFRLFRINVDTTTSGSSDSEILAGDSGVVLSVWSGGLGGT